MSNKEQPEIDIKTKLNQKFEQAQVEIDRLNADLREAIMKGESDQALQLWEQIQAKEKVKLRDFFENSNTEEFYEKANEFVADKGNE